ncbi:hypothetical protein [Ammoniphilus sp. CFH 90114]|uniref:hypothetical protein n=1 Tax=Ammoniphilus sp. CFH 90114 TaxID=2493665 RepID=UPI00100F7B35|nr:hypothetical protein [Ammoniphilus sp. CFH 90114]RXT14871.1 hypothetical protein EIZ39_01270 [Ammoniphilus sp. CFH 90114]
MNTDNKRNYIRTLTLLFAVHRLIELLFWGTENFATSFLRRFIIESACITGVLKDHMEHLNLDECIQLILNFGDLEKYLKKKEIEEIISYLENLKKSDLSIEEKIDLANILDNLLTTLYEIEINKLRMENKQV